MDTLRDRRELEELWDSGKPLADMAVTHGCAHGSEFGTARRVVDPDFWRGRRVLLTGHTGFKGAWLSLWLQSLGARVTGFSIGVPDAAVAVRAGEGRRGDGEHRGRRARPRGGRGGGRGGRAGDRHPHGGAVARAAAPSWSRSQTYETNVMGTVNVLDAVRLHGDEVRAIVNVTSDKCYENREWEWGYREDEPMGGFDPYSSSKGCSELVTDAFRRSFFSDADGPRLASARAGNVIGGGDWGEDRLVPDIMRAALAGEQVRVRNPSSIRPWQHVLNPLSGYLVLAQALWDAPRAGGGLELRPDRRGRPSGWLDRRADRRAVAGGSALGAGRRPAPARGALPEARLLQGACSARLAPRPRPGGRRWSSIVDWYRELRDGADMRAVTLGQIEAFQYAAARS